LSGTSPGSPENILDIGRIPESKENGKFGTAGKPERTQATFG
jgi:hypothetical protein